MWVFDGEQWTLDDGGLEPRVPKPETARPRYEEHLPELQVIEIVPVRPQRRPDELPPIPMP
jgi:hypothetical protein